MRDTPTLPDSLLADEPLHLTLRLPPLALAPVATARSAAVAETQRAAEEAVQRERESEERLRIEAAAAALQARYAFD